MEAKHLRLIVSLGFILVVFWLIRPSPPEADPAACAGPPLRSVEERELAQEQGYMINPQHGCIDKASYEQVQRQQAEYAARQAARAAKAAEPVVALAPSLVEARRGFQTRVSARSSEPFPPPTPPAHLFVRTDYTNPQGRALPAFVTPDPDDGQKHPAIVWLTGGDTNSLGDFWTAGPESNDQSARAFREAGIVMMFPVLRGGNDDAGEKEYFLGEVEDVLAAADRLAALPYVDPTRIYLGGHSTGGTLALLTAETSGRFRAVFAFGPVTEIDRYPTSLAPAALRDHGELELKLRSPIHWLASIASPTYVIEGEIAPGNSEDLHEICGKSQNPMIHCASVPGHDHFSVLHRVTRVIAARMAVGEVSIRADDFGIK